MNHKNRNLSGALWKNEYRTTETQPNLKGECEIDGKLYKLAAWTSKEGGKKPVVSIRFTLKDQEQAPVAPAAPAAPAMPDDFADDIPF